MKKLLSLLLIASTLITLPVLNLNVSAADDKTILRGTPKIDGSLDDIYKQSSSMTLTNLAFTTNGKGSSKTTDVSATAYVLYDDKNLYICATVSDNDVMSADDNYIKTDANPWQNDNVEFWIGEGSGADKYKVTMDAYGKRIFGNPAHPKQSAITGAAKTVSGGFSVEIAIPWINGSPSKEVRCSIQVNDLSSDGSVVASGFQYDKALDKNYLYTLSDKSVTTAAVTTAAPAKASANTAAPQTGDSSSLFIQISACAITLSAFMSVYFKKNRKKS